MEDDDDSKFKFSYVPAEIDEYGNPSWLLKVK